MKNCFAARGFRSAVQAKSGVPHSRLLPTAGCPITNHAMGLLLLVDVYGLPKTRAGRKVRRHPVAS